ncbi:Leucine Rich repeat [Phytophthora infestans]|uniref:Leucine Rich repeat n=1 Tax=Phytophthora infestans TaxID=4787 RepID=A0A833SS31_PHYIN|nr:Leucine Rich repeat [Phytophthora infestans]
MARQAQPSAIVPKSRHENELSGDSDDDEVDTNLDEDLLTEIRTLVEKEKYLEQLQDQLRQEHGGDIDDSASDNGDDNDNELHLRRVRPKPRGEDATKVKSLQTRVAPYKNVEIAREHFRICFVEVNLVQLRDLRTLVLVGQDLNILHLRTLSKNLFLFSALKSVNLSDNQLDDSGSKEIRDIMCCPGLQTLDLSRNLLGRLTARTLCERLRHQVKLLSLDLDGNLFFSDGGAAACEIARLFAKAVAVNEFLLHFSLSVPDQRERSVPLGDQWTKTATRREPAQVHSRDLRDKHTELSAATEFSRQLAEQLRQGGKRSSLHSLGLCFAEVSRRVVLNIVKTANRLTALDLSFAFIGIPGAQVVAAALRIDGYSTLTQLNMRCNRTKSMGARAILEALGTNERLTALDLSHNEIRSDILDAVVELLQCNKVLSRLDLSRNEMIRVDSEEELRCLRDAVVDHGGLLSLGQLKSLGANEAQERELQSALNKNRIADDHVVLASINTATSPPTDEAVPRTRPMASTIVELDDSASQTTVWQRKITESGRISLKWRMAVRTKPSASGREPHNSPLEWQLIVNRTCEVRGSLHDEAASAHLRLEEAGHPFVLYSAVAYCDAGDTMFLKLGLDHQTREKLSDAKQLHKVYVKDIVFIPHHPQDCRHLLASMPQSFPGAATQWRMKTQRRVMSSSEDDPIMFFWEGVVQRVYIHTTGIYRLLVRVQFPMQLPTTKKEIGHMLEARFWWKLQRSSCWNPHTNSVVLEGRYSDMHGVVQRGHNVVFYLPAMEWMAGEYLQLSVTAPSDDMELRVVQFQLFHEVDSWENPSTQACLSFTA